MRGRHARSHTRDFRRRGSSLQHQLAALPPQHRQHPEGHGRRRQHGGAPAGGQRHRHHQRRRQRPAQRAGDAVRAVGMAQPAGVHLAVEQGVVGRVEHTIAQAGHHRAGGQHGVAGGRGIAQRGQPQQRQPAQQHRPGAEAVDHKARCGLHHAGDDKEDRQQQAQLGVADVEFRLQPRKQRRQQQLAEVADGMRQAHQADHAGVLAPGRGGAGRKRGGGHAPDGRPGHCAGLPPPRHGRDRAEPSQACRVDGGRADATDV